MSVVQSFKRQFTDFIGQISNLHGYASTLAQELCLAKHFGEQFEKSQFKISSQEEELLRNRCEIENHERDKASLEYEI